MFAAIHILISLAKLRLLVCTMLSCLGPEGPKRCVTSNSNAIYYHIVRICGLSRLVTRGAHSPAAAVPAQMIYSVVAFRRHELVGRNHGRLPPHWVASRRLATRSGCVVPHLYGPNTGLQLLRKHNCDSSNNPPAHATTSLMTHPFNTRARTF